MSSRLEKLKEFYYGQCRAAGCPKEQAANYYKAGVILQPKQLRFAAEARRADSSDGPVEIGFGGARGGGKSFLMMAQIGVDDCQRLPGLKCLLLRKVGKANIEAFQDLRMRLFMGLEHEFSAHKGTLTFENGSRIIAGHFQNEKDIDAYLGLEYDVIGIEEATTLTSRKYLDISTCCRTSKPNWRPRMYSTTNPGGVGHAWYKTRFILPYNAGTEKRSRFIQSLVTDNRFNNTDYVRVLDDLTGWRNRAWRHGDWDIAAGQFFTTFRHEVHVFPNANVPEFDERKAKTWRISLDYGFTHFTAVYVGCEDGDGNHYILREHCERGWLPQQHAPAIKNAVAANLHYRSANDSRKLTLDDCGSVLAGTDVFARESDGRSIAQDYRDQGLTLVPAVTDRVNGWAEIQRLLGDPSNKERPVKPKLFIHRRCVRLIDCLPSLQHDPNNPEDVLKVDVDDDGIGGDDPADSLRYMLAKKVHTLKSGRLTGV